MYGLKNRDIEMMISAAEQLSNIESMIIFGSRAMGNYKRGSDVDIAVKGKDITHEDIMILNEQLNEVYPMPYYFDVVHYETISNMALVKHIDTIGKEFYQRLN